MFLHISFRQRQLLLATPGQTHIIKRLVVDGEEPAGRAIFRRHVRDSRAVSERQRTNTRTIEFDEAAHHTLGAEHLRYCQHQVRSEEHTSELQSLKRISYAYFCLDK